LAIVGHFDNLTEAQKLVQSQLLSGVIDEVIKDGQILPKLPVTQINGKSLIYNRENSTLPSASFFDIHEELAWNADIAYTQVEVSLKRIARQDILDHFIEKTYKDPNDYKAQVIREMSKICAYTLEEKIIYGDATTYTKEFDGLWGLCDSSMRTENHATGGALSLAKWRLVYDNMKLKPNFWLMPHTIGRRLDAMMQEAGIASWVGMGGFNFAPNQLGVMQQYFMGVPIIRSDFMTQTEGDSARTGGSNASIFGVHLGNLGQADAGVCMLLGGDTGGVEFFHMVELPDLEDYDAAGIRLVAYCAMALGGTKGLGHLCNITDAAVTA